MVSSEKHRREKGKWKIEIRREKLGQENHSGEKDLTQRRRREEHRVHREEKASDKEVEDEEEETQEEKDSGTVDAAARKARDGAHERNRNSLEARFFAEGVERAGRGVARKVAAEKGKLVVEPHGEFAAVAPHPRGASQEYKIAENGQKPQPRACSPIHKSSQAAHMALYSWTPGTARRFIRRRGW